ncbi:unnamed protein product, partial [Prorocentrum cordatum]
VGLVEGDFVLVHYRVGGARIWHERLIVVLQPTAPFGTGILTPDGHAYVEAIAPNSADVRDDAIPGGGAVGGQSPQMGADEVYRFRGLPLPGEVAAASASTRAARGLPPGPPIALNTAGSVIVPVGPPAEAAAAAAPARAPAAPAAGAVGGLAGLAAALGGGPGGGAAEGGALVPAAAVPPPAHAAAPFPAGGAADGALGAAAGALGGAPWSPLVAQRAALGGLAAGLAAIAGLPGGDTRIQTVTLDTEGVRHVDFRAGAVRLHELPWGGWPFKGPRTLLSVLSFICRNGGTPLGWHTKWVSEEFLEPDDPGVDAHLVRCRLLDMELVGRALQTRGELYRDRFVASSEFGSGAAPMSGALDAGGNARVVPARRDWLAAEKAREASVAKERRK